MCQVIHGQLLVYTVSSGINEKIRDTLHGDNNYIYIHLFGHLQRGWPLLRGSGYIPKL